MSIYILGANGTLGLQLSLMGRRLNLSVTCLVRRYTNETDALTYLGARVFYGNIKNHNILLESIFGSNVIIDASTVRLFDTFELLEYDAKCMLVRIAEELKLDRFVFFSLVNAEKFDTISLIEAKLYLESVIKKSSVPYTIFRLPGFYQGLIKDFAIPVFDRYNVYITKNFMPISFIDCIDVARLVMRSFTSPKFVNKTVTISGLKPWAPFKVVRLCEVRAGAKARIRYIRLVYILTVRLFSSLFEWYWYLTRRLTLIDIIRRNTADLVLDPGEMFRLFEITPSELRSFDYFLYYYYDRAFKMIFKKYGIPGDDEKEIEKWREQGIAIIDAPIAFDDEEK